MGKGDKKSKKGKLSKGSYGVTRPHKVKASAKATTKKATPKKAAKEETAAPKKKAATKKAE
jgi:30S ribosomal protein S31